MNRQWVYRWAPLGCVLLVTSAALSWAQEPTRGDEPQQQAEAQVDAALLERLLGELDAEDFHVREQATRRLIELGAPARQRVEQLQANPPSPEVKSRVERILRQLQLADIRRNAVRLDAIFEQVRLANRDRLDRESLGAMLEQLIVVLQSATGNDHLQLPVQLSDLKIAPADTFVRDSLVIVRGDEGKRVRSVRNSIVLADVAVDISGCDNSIIIARAAAEVTFPKNSIVIGGFWLDSSSARDSILLSGHGANVTFPKNGIIAAGENVRTSSSTEEATFVNTQPPERTRGAPKLVATEGLILREAQPKNPLADKIVVTHAASGIVLFRRASGGGELVARLNQPVKHPDGEPVPELEGWQACYTAYYRHALFTDGERIVLMPVSK